MQKFKRIPKQLMLPRYRWIRALIMYFLLVAVTALILYWRFPNNVAWPNFYGEDGSIYLQNILDKGWLEGSISPFNGYFIIGLYIICGLGWIINLLLGGTIFTLAAAFSVAAIISMAAIICLPYVLFRDVFGRLKMLIVVVLGVLAPLPVSPHIVIGTIGNQKWIFFYLAFLLVMYRILNYKKLSLQKTVAADLTILVSAYTNSTVYLLIPLLFVPYIQDYFSAKKRVDLWAFIKRRINQKQTQSLVGLCLLLIPQVVYVAVNGIPKIANYLDTPFSPNKAIELFVNRTYLYGITHEINGRMNDFIVVLLFFIILAAGWFMLKGKQRLVFFSGIYAAGVASILFVLNRPGVTDHFFNYSDLGSGPDQFFYAQTLVMYLPLSLLIFSLILRHKALLIRYSVPVLIISFIVASGLYGNANAGERWRNASVFENDAGTFIDQAIHSCDTQNDKKVRVVVYPYKEGSFALTADRGLICNEDLQKYQDSAEDFGLTLNNNDHLPIVKEDDFTQTFQSENNGLSGLRIFISTFGKVNREETYKLTLMDETCSRVIREQNIPLKLTDNSYSNVRFEPLADSKERYYCFTLIPPRDGNFDFIAIQRSKPDVYKGGDLIENGQALASDVVFQPLYTQEKP